MKMAFIEYDIAQITNGNEIAAFVNDSEFEKLS